MNTPQFSVIIAAYNRAHVLARAIDSVINQTCADFELLIVDDGSTDTTAELIGQYEDPRVVYLPHAANRGQNCALNRGIEHSRGQFISFLDSDDEWFPRMLERVAEKFKSDPEFGCVYSMYAVRDCAGRIKTPIGSAMEGHIFKEALESAQVSPPSALTVRRECLAAVGGFEPGVVICQDDLMCLELARKFKFGRITEVLAVMHSDSGSRVSDDALQTALGYHYLYKTFAADVLRECGRGTLAKHYLHAGKLFLRAGRRMMALKLLSLGVIITMWSRLFSWSQCSSIPARAGD